MPHIQDSTQSFTITLTALLEGRGIITYIMVENYTQNISYEWDAGSWITMPQAVEADGVGVYIEVENTGATTDTLYGEFVSAQVTPAEALIQEMPNITIAPAVGSIGSAIWRFTMPPNAVNITINAGHIEGSAVSP